MSKLNTVTYAETSIPKILVSDICRLRVKKKYSFVSFTARFKKQSLLSILPLYFRVGLR